MPRIDIHLNLAGTGTANSGCWVSPAFRRRYTFLFLKWMHGITNEQMRTTVDEDWAEKVAELVADSEVDYGMVLGFDAVYDAVNGLINANATQMVVPADWVFRVCKQHRNLLPCPGLNPYRRDALERLDEYFAKGAVCIKWLPPAQNIDPADSKVKPFYQKLADKGLPLLVHTASERTFRSIDPSLGQARKLLPALDMGVKIIAAHCGTRVIATGEEDQVPLIIKMLEKYPNLWVDNSGLCNPGRFQGLVQISREPLIRQRTLYGSDWPVPINAFYYLPQLGLKKVMELERIQNLITRDVEIKRLFGFEDSTMTRAHDVLANLHHWIR